VHSLRLCSIRTSWYSHGCFRGYPFIRTMIWGVSPEMWLGAHQRAHQSINPVVRMSASGGRADQVHQGTVMAGVLCSIRQSVMWPKVVESVKSVTLPPPQAFNSVKRTCDFSYDSLSEYEVESLFCRLAHWTVFQTTPFILKVWESALNRNLLTSFHLIQ
jgi:hypothetical protein